MKIAFTETNINYSSDTITPKKDGIYMVRMETDNDFFYNFITYYHYRGWLTRRKVTHFIDIEEIKEA